MIKDPNTTWKIVGMIATLVIVLSLPIYHLKNRPSLSISMGDNHEQAAEFTGSEACRDCHKTEYDKWSDSHHRWAMAPASENTVLGDFDNAEFTHFGQTSRFYRRDGNYFVHTQGVDGKPGDFQITHTFGWYPLQQYLVPFPGGRLQCLPIAWDVVKQRWYHLYPDTPLDPGDWLYWTNNGQNWNGMCAECHATDLKKGLRLPHRHLCHHLLGNQRGLRGLPWARLGTCRLGPASGNGPPGGGEPGPCRENTGSHRRATDRPVRPLSLPAHVHG